MARKRTIYTHAHQVKDPAGVLHTVYVQRGNGDDMGAFLVHLAIDSKEREGRFSISHRYGQRVLANHRDRHVLGALAGELAKLSGTDWLSAFVAPKDAPVWEQIAQLVEMAERASNAASFLQASQALLRPSVPVTLPEYVPRAAGLPWSRKRWQDFHHDDSGDERYREK